MLLPNFEFAVIGDEKLRDYCLNPEHPMGKHKAKVFLRKLNLTQSDAQLLKDLILKGISVIECVESESSDFGRRFTVDFILVNFDKEALVRTSWIIKTEEFIPRLTSCYVIEK
ncbi:MAG: hypothetical protein JWO03_1327 [Bacteroidetes bacterium]|nr:hypothetical protein [Bacteroidota bacterium]